MRSTIVLLISVAVGGGAVGSFLQSRAPADAIKHVQSSKPIAAGEPREHPSGAKDTAQLLALAEQLDAEIEARTALQERVDTLSAQLSQLLKESPAGGIAPAESPLDADIPTSDGVWFNEQALIDAGIEVTEANRIKAVYEELAVERLYLQDRAVREGWNRAQRREAFAELQERQEALRAELGEDSYDAYLYASGQSNRVRVQAVLAGSAADSVGIRNGDYIIRYADQRVYSGRQLRGATAQGTSDEMVAVVIQRNDTVQEVYIPRGPLGIRMSSASVAP